ncbi:MAG: PEGA domain-containing protein [Candidatus Cloacimonetes bacterium]|nr:PEGA domain-containing protein [Candidatus Cloacimonadota bacterium]
MKKIFIIFILFLAVYMFGSQFQILQEPVEVTMHAGFVNLPEKDRYDINGDLCGMLIVRTGIEDMNIDSPMRHRQINKAGEYWVVLSPGTAYVDLKKVDYATLMVNFRQSINRIESGKVYEMIIDGDGGMSEIPVMITCNQSGVEVLVDGEVVGKTENKMLTVNLKSGEREITVSKEGFASQTIAEDVSLENNSFDFQLVPAMPAAVKITTTPEGATIYIDDLKFGESPKSSFFDAGTYPIRIEKENYETINDQITIIEPETEKNYELVDIRATLTVITYANATVKFNGESYKGGINKLFMQPQTINFKVEQEFCETIEKAYPLKKGENKTFELFPEDISASLTVKTYANATVKINGKSYKGGFASKKFIP